MLKQRYVDKIIDNVNLVGLNRARFFIFGSSLEREKFGDVDIGVVGEIEKRDIRKLKELLAESTLPYFVDVVDFNSVSKEFKNNVFNQKILWIKR